MIIIIIIFNERYNFLNKFVGSGATTGIVLIKCALDQIFFATQQDLLFLAICAYNEFEQLPKIVYEVKKLFLTVWIMDCSLWPLVNFFGFAFVPFKLLPSYMAGVSFFWQLYISSVGNSNSDNPSTPVCASGPTETELMHRFNEIDLNHVRTKT